MRSNVLPIPRVIAHLVFSYTPTRSLPPDPRLSLLQLQARTSVLGTLR